jgi:hypothetical protein
VTENFDLLTAFPLAQSVKGEAGAELGLANTQNLLQTSERSWSEADVKSLLAGKVAMDEAAGDHKGPITNRTLAVDGRARRTGTRHARQAC